MTHCLELTVHVRVVCVVLCVVSRVSSFSSSKTVGSSKAAGQLCRPVVATQCMDVGSHLGRLLLFMPSCSVVHAQLFVSSCVSPVVIYIPMVLLATCGSVPCAL